MKIAMSSQELTALAARWREAGDDLTAVEITMNPGMAVYGSMLLSEAVARFSADAETAADALGADCHEVATAIDGRRDDGNAVEQTLQRALKATEDRL